MENAGLEESDFEKWSPSDTIKGHRCLMGHTTTYIRRKKVNDYLILGISML